MMTVESASRNVGYFATTIGEVAEYFVCVMNSGEEIRFIATGIQNNNGNALDILDSDSPVASGQPFL